ncbi:MAG: CRTAC1 family protein [Gammaproteobacteria bacterium]|nr:CRTAC1 family protein [Gammaproteobacteria bacterium]
MFQTFRAARLVITLSLTFIASFFSNAAAADISVLTHTELSRLQAVCADNGSASEVNNSKKTLLLYHTDGYIPSAHFDLPTNTRADDLDSAAVVLCLEDATVEIEVCNFNLFFSVARVRQQYRVEAVPLDESGERVGNLFINGPEPASCNNLNEIDNTVTSVTGDPVSTQDVMDFITANNLDREDNDRDGLRNIEEFRIDTDPNDVDSPIAQAVVKVNGSTSPQLYAGETAEIRLDLYPSSNLGNAADYFFWADMPDGQYVFQYPAGFLKSNIIEPILSAPLVRLFNFRLLQLQNLEAGEYQFFFEARDNEGSIEMSSAFLTVVNDDCREEVTLPLNINASWENQCDSMASIDDDYLARYYTFTLGSQNDVLLELDAGGVDAKIILRAGSGRSGAILTQSEQFSDSEILSTALEAGTYTIEVILEKKTEANESFLLTSSNELIPWQFTEVTLSAGFDYMHGYREEDLDRTDPSHDLIIQGGGVAAGDYDQDGWTDLYVTRGTIGPNLLFRNLGDGTFEETGASAGIGLEGRFDSGATFADIDADGWPDLFVGGINGTELKLFKNLQNGTFEDITGISGLPYIINSFSASFADYDKDGDLDMYVSHWNQNKQGKYLFQNDGFGVFTDVSEAAGIPDDLMADYTPIFTDINNDGWLDLLVASDFNTTQIYINNKDGTFNNTTSEVITDDNAMGAAVGDYDNDGDLDWFITSIFDPNGIPADLAPGVHTGATGNRLYRNRGDGTFEDVTDEAGVRYGSWGWGSCFADFNNDGFLDIFHVNGFVTENFISSATFLSDGSRLFISNQDGTFTEHSLELKLIDRGQGRGINCFDYDRDGDIDIFVANNQQSPVLFRNDGGNDQNFLHIKVAGEDLNSEAIGARIYVTVGGSTQMREIYSGNNFISNNPAEAYFGIGNNDLIDEIRVIWPSGAEKNLVNVQANQLLTIFK